LPIPNFSAFSVANTLSSFSNVLAIMRVVKVSGVEKLDSLGAKKAGHIWATVFVSAKFNLLEVLTNRLN
jgi:hypothetical protein